MCTFLGSTPMPDGRTLGKAILVEHPGIGASHDGLRGDLPGSDGIHRDSGTGGLGCQPFRNAGDRLLCCHIAETVRHCREGISRGNVDGSAKSRAARARKTGRAQSTAPLTQTDCR